MTKWVRQAVEALHDPVTGAFIGMMGKDGKEYVVNASQLAETTGAYQGLFMGSPPAIGSSTPNTGSFTSLRAAPANGFAIANMDGSGTPGNVTQNVARGRVAVAAAAQSITVTNSLVTVNSAIFVTLAGVDATLTQVLNVVKAAGSFTINCNAVATAAVPIDYFVINN